MPSLQTHRQDVRLCLHPDFRLCSALPHHDIIADAKAAHELLDLVRQLEIALVDIVSPLASYGAGPCQASLMRAPSTCVCQKCRTDMRRAALDAAAPWLGNADEVARG